MRANNKRLYHSQMNLLRIYPSKTALTPLSGTNQHKMGITNLRKQLDRIDTDIVSLLEKRLHIADEIGTEKNRLGMPLTDEHREHEIIRKLSAHARNPILKNTVPSIFSPIFRLSKTKRILSLENNIPFNNITIIGFGIIGGSIAKAIKSKNSNIRINTLDRNSNDIRIALHEGIVDKVHGSIAQLVKTCELIILASPIDSIVPLAQKINHASDDLRNKVIVIDCASVKEPIVKEFEKLNNENVEFIATHPMAGSEKKGFENSNALLFADQPWVITPHEKNTEPAINDIYQFIRFLGGNPVEMTATEHDQKVALVSHLTFLVSIMLFEFVRKKNKDSIKLAGPGFRTTTRLASKNPFIHAEIIKHNRKNIQTSLSQLIQFMQKFSVETDATLSFFDSVKKHREHL